VILAAHTFRLARRRARPEKFAERGGGQFVQRWSGAVVNDRPVTVILET
jgi:hypothetical protein